MVRCSSLVLGSFATERTVAMKSFAIGLSVRFFDTTTAIGRRFVGRRTGNDLTERPLAKTSNIDLGRTVMNRAVETR